MAPWKKQGMFFCPISNPVWDFKQCFCSLSLGFCFRSAKSGGGSDLYFTEQNVDEMKIQSLAKNQCSVITNSVIHSIHTY